MVIGWYLLAQFCVCFNASDGKRHFVLCVACGTILLLSGCDDPTSQNGSISAQPTVVSGYVLESECSGEKLSSFFDTSFELENCSSRTVFTRLSRISCGCIGVQNENGMMKVGDGLSLEPGDRARYEFLIDPVEGRRVISEGVLFKGDHGTLNVPLKLNVFQDFSVSPKRSICEFRDPTTKSIKHQISVRAYVRQNNAESKNNDMTLRVQPDSTTVQLVSKQLVHGTNIWYYDWNIAVLVNLPSDEHRLPTTLLVSLIDPVLGVTRLENAVILRKVKYGISYPKTVVFNDTQNPEHRSKKFRLTSQNGSEFRIKNVEVGDLPLEANWNKTSSTSQWITLTWRDGSERPFRGRCVILTDDTVANSISVDVSSMEAP